MERQVLKKEAKKILNNNFLFFFLLFLPALITQLCSVSSGTSDTYNYFINNFQYKLIENSSISFAFSAVTSLLITSAGLVCIDVFRDKVKFEKAIPQAFKILDKGQYFIAFILITVLQVVYVFLWTLLLVVPGIIKSISYSQAFYIYRDHIDNGKPITYLQAITKSRELMDGHKMDYFVMELSFIGWLILVPITGGIAAIWVLPYYQLTFCNFYKKLVENNQLSKDAQN
ncbi:conserved membrane hypothetical protein [Oenococcus oeni]|nr:conserved membrane hypothetical protein [Oenococcus oeni]